MTAVDTILNKLIKDQKTPSVQYVFFNTDHKIYSFQSGYADINKQTKTNERSTYNGFSTSKTFTALAIMLTKGTCQLCALRL
jgi:CubicO group peptidase (beta-lactamase class C family)